MRAVIFDMDGLMFDSERIYWEVTSALAREFGKEITERTLIRMTGRKPFESICIFAEDLGIAEEPQKLLDLRERNVAERFRMGCLPMPGLHRLLDDLQGKARLAIATSARQQMVDIIIGQAGIRERFDVIQTSDDVINGKPNPEIYLKAMAKLGVGPEVCTVLEDSSNGARAGKAAGAYVIAVPTAHAQDQDFDFVDYRAANLDDAREHLLALWSEEGHNCAGKQR